jgi:hypothetical protein
VLEGLEKGNTFDSVVAKETDSAWDAPKVDKNYMTALDRLIEKSPGEGAISDGDIEKAKEGQSDEVKKAIDAIVRGDGALTYFDVASDKHDGDDSDGVGDNLSKGEFQKIKDMMKDGKWTFDQGGNNLIQQGNDLRVLTRIEDQSGGKNYTKKWSGGGDDVDMPDKNPGMDSRFDYFNNNIEDLKKLFANQGDLDGSSKKEYALSFGNIDALKDAIKKGWTLEQLVAEGKKGNKLVDIIDKPPTKLA